MSAYDTLPRLCSRTSPKNVEFMEWFKKRRRFCGFVEYAPSSWQISLSPTAGGRNQETSAKIKSLIPWLEQRSSSGHQARSSFAGHALRGRSSQKSGPSRATSQVKFSGRMPCRSRRRSFGNQIRTSRQKNMTRPACQARVALT